MKLKSQREREVKKDRLKEATRREMVRNQSSQLVKITFETS